MEHKAPVPVSYQQDIPNDLFGYSLSGKNFLSFLQKELKIKKGTEEIRDPTYLC
jgi:hypothetical protein